MYGVQWAFTLHLSPTRHGSRVIQKTNTLIFAAIIRDSRTASRRTSELMSMAFNTRRPLVFFDLETTGFGQCDIIQLAAVSDGQSFNAYMVPRCSIESKAAAITGFSVVGDRLYQHGRAVRTIPHQQAIEGFLAFLRKLGRPLLVSHNARDFDGPVLARALDEWHRRSAFLRVTSGFLDTFPLAKYLLPGQPSYSQENLVKAVLGEQYRAHDALEDAKALEKLYQALRPTAAQINPHIFTLPA
ncbi:hypothetical protein GJAV_G00232930 [Gymnothorax javanicus]|nr:hypothetical protein GJAV_G00232930 [Gymnothorax javanicus]